MKTFEIVVHNPTGLHARPAKVLVNTAKTFKSAVRIGHGAKQANAKSLISVLTLGVESGGVVRLEVEGEDEDVAALALQTIIEQGLGEGTGKLVTVPVPEVQKPAAVMPAPAAATAPCASEPGLPQRLLRGIPAAPGFGIGPIFRLERAKITVSDTFTGVNQERALLQQALEAAREQLQQLRAQLLGQAIASEAAIFEVHLELLEDPDLLEAVYANIERQHNAAQAWQAAIEARARMMAALDDPLLAARAADIHDVGYRVLRLLVGADTSEAIQLPDYPVLVVAHDISPSDTASLDPQRVLGFCTAVGGPTAHAAIIARAMGFPAVVSVGEDVLKLDNGTLAILDGVAGTLVIEPDAETLARAQEAQRLYQARRLAAQASSAEPAVTRDGHRVEIVANIGGVADARKAHAAGAEGVGLLRTEFLFLDRASAPTETEQFEVYRDIALALEGRPVIIRTLDIGGDKPLPYINLAPEENPFLGERGIRLCLARPDLL
ncbi:MAG: HPr family phosphocarrier protein, partial [Chloroflexi bacterium]|nr:HPr family phosphocarrier protein [Chloroflexota bacterium]